MLAMDVIELAESEQTLQIKFARKLDRTPRFCTGFHKFDVITISDPYPILCMGKCLDCPGDATLFPTSSASTGYWKVSLAVEYRDKTAFSSDHRLVRRAGRLYDLEDARGRSDAH